MFKIFDGRESFYQWDLDQKLIIGDSSINEVHFCNKTDSCSLVCEVYEEQGLRLVNVPNILLTYDLPVRVYGYCNNYTKLGVVFSVKARTKPSDYVYTETEVKTWERLEAEIIGAMDALADAEAERVAAEAERVAAEAKRVNDFSSLANALKGAASGAAVAMADISPNEHNLNIKISGENIADLSAVKVSKYGLNLFNGELRACIFDQNKTPEYNFESFEQNPLKRDVFQSLKIYLPAGTYSINSSVALNIVRRVINNDKQIAYSKIKTTHDTFTVNYPQYVGFTFRRNDEAIFKDTDKVWITLGAKPTEYEPYIEPTIYIPSADGTIKNVTSLYPAATLITDTAGAVIEAEYNRDINKAFAELQQAIISLGGNL